MLKVTLFGPRSQTTFLQFV